MRKEQRKDLIPWTLPLEFGCLKNSSREADQYLKRSSRVPSLRRATKYGLTCATTASRNQSFYERVSNFYGSTREQGVDERIHLAMAHAILDEQPGTMALLTGDGKEYEEGVIYPASLRRALNKGWKVVLYG